MGVLDKDAAQKEKAIRYCISNGILPYLEVVVDNAREITDTRTVITDLDVLGIEISRRGMVRRVLFDCKTVGKMSAINRAFWASGVMSYTGCDEAYVILTKKSSEAHRLSAKAINVHLFQEMDFDEYAQMANIDYLDTLTYTSKIANWHALYSAFENYSAIKALTEYLNAKLPLEQDNAKALRELIGLVRASKGEFDPAKPDYMAIYCSIVLSLLLVLSPICSQITDIFDNSMEKSEFEKILRYYIWGGRESYIHRRQLKVALAEAAGQKKRELELPGWQDFVQLIRLLMDAPSEIKEALIPCRQLSLRCVSRKEPEIDANLYRTIRSSSRTTQFMLACSGYICKSTGLPNDFHDFFRESLSELEDASNK